MTRGLGKSPINGGVRQVVRFFLFMARKFAYNTLHDRSVLPVRIHRSSGAGAGFPHG